MSEKMVGAIDPLNRRRFGKAMRERFHFVALTEFIPGADNKSEGWASSEHKIEVIRIQRRARPMRAAILDRELQPAAPPKRRRRIRRAQEATPDIFVPANR